MIATSSLHFHDKRHSARNVYNLLLPRIMTINNWSTLMQARHSQKSAVNFTSRKCCMSLLNEILNTSCANSFLVLGNCNMWKQFKLDVSEVLIESVKTVEVLT